MAGRLNIPAPVLVKQERDADMGEELAIESASPARGRGGFGRTGFFELDAEKSVFVFPGPPVPQTDTGGWVEYTQARE